MHLENLVLQLVHGIPLLWTLWKPGEVSCIERCPHFRIKKAHMYVFGTQYSVL